MYDGFVVTTQIDPLKGIIGGGIAVGNMSNKIAITGSGNERVYFEGLGNGAGIGKGTGEGGGKRIPANKQLVIKFVKTDVDGLSFFRRGKQIDIRIQSELIVHKGVYQHIGTISAYEYMIAIIGGNSGLA